MPRPKMYILVFQKNEIFSERTFLIGKNAQEFTQKYILYLKYTAEEPVFCVLLLYGFWLLFELYLDTVSTITPSRPGLWERTANPVWYNNKWTFSFTWPPTTDSELMFKRYVQKTVTGCRVYLWQPEMRAFTGHCFWSCRFMNCRCVEVWINRSDATEAEFWKAAKNDSNFFCFGQNFNASSLKNHKYIFAKTHGNVFIYVFSLALAVFPQRSQQVWNQFNTHGGKNRQSAFMCLIPC